MKNKHAKQMMIDCGNDELLGVMFEQRIYSMLHSIMKTKGGLSVIEAQLVTTKAIDKFKGYLCKPEIQCKSELSSEGIINTQVKLHA